MLNHRFLKKAAMIFLIYLLVLMEALRFLPIGQALAEGEQNSPWPEDAEIELVEAGMTELTVKWSAPDGIDVSFYDVAIHDENGEPVTTKTIGMWDELKEEVTITDLNPGTSYIIKVYVTNQNEMTMSPPLTKENVKTLPDNDAPTWPNDATLDITATGHNFIEVTWPEAEDNGGIAAYEWEISQGETVIDSGEMPETNVKVENLQAEESYTFRVIARDSGENLSAALEKEDIVTATTPAAPEWPEDAEITVTDVGPDFIKVYWPWINLDEDVTLDNFYWELLDENEVKVDEGQTRVTNTTINFSSSADADTSFTFRVIAKDDAGNESSALESTVATTHFPPEWSKNPELAVTNTGDNFIEVEWPEAQLSDNNVKSGDEDLAYDVRLYSTYSNGNTIYWSNQILSEEHLSYRFEDLILNMDYKVHISPISTKNGVEERGEALESSVIKTDKLTDANQDVATQLLNNSNIDGIAAVEASHPSVSSDGRYVVFQSDSTDIIAGDNQPEEGSTAIYWLDTETGDVQPVSLDNDGNAQNNCRLDTAFGRDDIKGSVYPDVSADGRYVAFLSTCMNLAEDGNAYSVFVRDMKDGKTKQVNLDPATEDDEYPQSMNAVFEPPVISANGQHVLFKSAETRENNLYVHDLDANKIVQITEATKDENGLWQVHDISADGQFVTYSSYDNNDRVRLSSIYLYDRDANGNGVYDEAGDTSRTNIIAPLIEEDNQAGKNIGALLTGPGGSDHFTIPSISANGEKVAFLWKGNRSYPATEAVFLYDRINETYQRSPALPLSLSNVTNKIQDIVLNSDGTSVLFTTKYSFIHGDNNGVGDVFLWDTQADAVKRVSVASDGTEGDGTSAKPSISADGKTIVYQSDATNLVQPATEAKNHIYMTSVSKHIDVSVPTWSADKSLTADEIARNFVRLNWSAAQHSQGIQNYRIYSDEDGQREFLAEVSGTTLRHTVSGLDAGKKYTFVVEARNASGVESEDGPSVTVTTKESSSTEASLLATAQPGGMVDLIWDKATDHTITSYRIYRTNPDGMVTKLEVEDVDTDSYTDEGLAAETNYTYLIFTVDKDDAEQPYSVEASVKTLELFLDDITWDATTVQFSDLVMPEQDFTISVTGEPNREVTAAIQYKTYKAANGSLADEMHDESKEVILKESNEKSGLYEGSFFIGTGVAEITDVKVTITDGTGHTVSQNLQSLPLSIASSFEVDVSVPDEVTNEFSNVSLLVWSDQEGGERQKFNGNGIHRFTNLSPSKDYTITIFGEEEGNTRVLNKLELIHIRAGSGSKEEIKANLIPTSINIHVTDSEGNAYQYKRVTIYNAPTGSYIGRGNLDKKGELIWSIDALSPVEKRELRIVVEGNRPFVIEKEKVIEVAAGSNDLGLTMNAVQLGQITGQILNKDENNPIGRVNVRIMDKHSNWSERFKTDLEGHFGPMELPVGDYVITSNLGESIAFEKKEITITKNETLNVMIDYDHLQRYKVRLGEIKQRSIGSDWTTISSGNINISEIAAAYDFSITVESDKYFEENKARFHDEYPLGIWAKEGYQLKACIKEPIESCETVTLDDTTDISIDFKSDQKGTALITGKVVLSNGQAPKDIRFKLEQGEQALVANSNISNFKIPIKRPGQYELFVSTRDSEGRYGFTSIPVDAQEDVVTDIGTIKINTEGLFKSVSFNALDSLVNVGEIVTFRLGYDRAVQSLEDATFLLDIPEGTQLVTETVTENGELIEDPDVVDGILEISLDRLKDTIRYSVQLDDSFDRDLINVMARIRYTQNGEQMEEILGMVDTQVGAISINAPSEVDQPNIVVHGQAPPDSQIQIMDSSQLVAITQASPNGYWKAEVTLDGSRSPSWHRLQAVIDDQGVINATASVDVLYDTDQQKLEEIWIRHDPLLVSGWYLRNRSGMIPEKFEYTKINISNTIPRIPLTQFLDYPFDVKLLFNHPDKVSNVKIWFGGPDSNRAIDAILQEDGMYYAKVPSSTRVLGDLYVDYDVTDPFPKWGNSVRLDESSFTVGQEENQSEEDAGFLRSMFTSNQSESGLHISAKNKYTIEDWDDATISVDADYTTGRTLTTSDTANVTYPGGDASIARPEGGNFNLSWSAGKTTSNVNMDATISLDEFIAADGLAPWWADDATLVHYYNKAGNLELSWTPAADDLWTEWYNIYQDDLKIATISADKLSYEIAGLMNGETYDFQIEAVDPSSKNKMGPEITLTMGDQTASLSEKLFQQFKRTAHSTENEISKQFRSSTVSAAAGTAVKVGLKIATDGLANGYGMISWADTTSGIGAEWNNLQAMLADLEGGACPATGKAAAKSALDNAKTAIIADVTFQATGYAVGVGAAATGVGAPAGAAIAVATLAGGFMSTYIKDQAYIHAQEAYNNYMDQNPECEKEAEEKNEEEEKEEEQDDEERQPRIKPAWKLDPSGYVYEVHEDNRIQGVTTTVLFREGPADDWEVWDAEWWGEVNPQTTDVFGWYGWDVPKGQWQVVYEKDGYETTYSDVLNVPPPHFDVNIPITTTRAPKVESVKAYIGGGNDADEEGIEIRFDQYIQTNTISESTYEIVNTENDSQVAGEMTFVNTVKDPDDNEVTNTLRFIPDKDMNLDGEYKVTFRDVIQNYAGIPMQAEYTTTVTVEKAPKVTKILIMPEWSAALGTEKDMLGLPGAVQVMLSNDRTEITEVTWDNGTPTYDKDKAGKYDFAGTLVLPPGIANPDNMEAGVTVTVEKALEIPNDEDPDDGATDPDDGATDPDGGATDPDDGATDPDDGATDPDDGATDPDDGATDPDDGATDPDDGATDPDDGATDPNDDATDSDDNEERKGQNSAEQNKSDEKLPQTATHIFNLMLLGLMLILVGIPLILRKRKRS